jgi:hypothetical protein
MVRQHLKGLLKYIRELKRDLLELIQEMETTANNDTYTKRHSETCRPYDLHYDRGMEHQSSRGEGGLVGTLADLCTHSAGDIEATYKNISTPSTETARLTGSQQRCVGQKWAGALPPLFSIAGSSISGASEMKAIAGRVRRRSSFQGSQYRECEDDLPSTGIKRRCSMSSASFSVITGMPSGS